MRDDRRSVLLESRATRGRAPHSTAHRLGAVTLLTLAGASGARAAPITFNTALPVSEGEAIVREQLIVTRSADAEGGAKREVTEAAAVSVFGYGVTPRLAVFAVAPIVFIDRDVGGVRSEDAGPGDASLFARYEVFRRDGPGRTVRLAPFVGVTLPTGEEGRTGDGSTDVFGGLVFTAASTAWQYDGQLRYVANAEANGFERGDAASLHASLQRRLWPHEVPVDAPGFLYGVLEADVTHFDNDRIGGVDDPSSGGTLAFLAPGVQFAASGWIAEAAVRVPIVKDLNGAALEADYSVIASLRVSF